MELKNKKILVTGGAGFLGSSIVRQLVQDGLNQKDIIVYRSKELDLREKENCIKATKGIDIVIHAAGNVGGIGKNNMYPATLFYDNLIMGAHLLEASKINDVKKLVIIGTICAYPKYTPVPFKEENLWIGYPEETNAPYGLAKKMLLVGAQAYRKQYGLQSIYLLPVNLFGPGDNFDLESSHVIPALIKKFLEAVLKNKKYVVIWGDGSPTREFLYVEDAARGIILATKNYDKKEPINLGTGKEISIHELANLIAKLVGFTGEIRWDTTKPNGQPKRSLDISKAKKEFGFVAQADFTNALKKTIKWYKEHLT
ncbi:MAG: GDP-L-fucose synthase [Candidatus Levybacteria bacterium]|nr:GDP-L-fucose synthase [Candidatus Levybacteria bacterium]